MIPDYVKCRDCGVTMPADAMKDGECVDRQWCATQQCAQIDGPKVEDLVRAAVETEREACAMTAEHWFRASRVQSAAQHEAEHEVALRVAGAIRARGAQ